MLTIIVLIVFTIRTQTVSRCDEEYSVDNVTNVERGCVCLKEACAKKCCPLGQAYHREQKICIDFSEPFNPPVYRDFRLLPGYNATKELYFFYGKMNCSDELAEFRVPVNYPNYFHLRTDFFCVIGAFPNIQIDIHDTQTRNNNLGITQRVAPCGYRNTLHSNRFSSYLAKRAIKINYFYIYRRSLILILLAHIIYYEFDREGTFEHQSKYYNVKKTKCLSVGQSSSCTICSFQSDGKLYVKIETSVKVLIYEADKYCIDTFVSDTEGPHLNALICFVVKPEPYSYTMSIMLISCFFILLTVAVYAWLPELRNLHGMVLMAYLLCFFVGFLFLATMQILILKQQITEEICIVLTFIVYFSLLAAFFWLNVMCYDIWWTF
ncbi:hypothetical protein SFRURICE_018927, partial [Spodoptera frugiperda]